LEIQVNDYAIQPWVAVVVIAFTVWRAFHGPYSDEWWSSTVRFIRERLGVRR
jgi:hypothetical protein